MPSFLAGGVLGIPRLRHAQWRTIAGSRMPSNTCNVTAVPFDVALSIPVGGRGIHRIRRMPGVGAYARRLVVLAVAGRGVLANTLETLAAIAVRERFAVVRSVLGGLALAFLDQFLAQMRVDLRLGEAPTASRPSAISSKPHMCRPSRVGRPVSGSQPSSS